MNKRNNKTKNVLALSGALSIGTMVVAAPISSIATEVPTTKNSDETILDVIPNNEFKINAKVGGESTTLSWNTIPDVVEYMVVKMLKVDTEYVVVEETIVDTNSFEDTISEKGDYKYRVAPMIDGEIILTHVGEVFVDKDGNVTHPDGTKDPEVSTDLTKEQLQKIKELAHQFANDAATQNQVDKIVERFVLSVTSNPTIKKELATFYNEKIKDLDKNTVNTQILEYVFSSKEGQKLVNDGLKVPLEALIADYNIKVHDKDSKDALLALLGPDLISKAQNEYTAFYSAALKEEFDKEVKKLIDKHSLANKLLEIAKVAADENKVVATDLTKEQLQKIKELAHQFANDAATQSKVEKIVERFVLSVTSNPTIKKEVGVFYEEKILKLLDKETTRIADSKELANLEGKIKALEKEINSQILEFVSSTKEGKKLINDGLKVPLEALIADYNIKVHDKDSKNALLGLIGPDLFSKALNEYDKFYPAALNEEFEKEVKKLIDKNSLADKLLEIAKAAADEKDKDKLGKLSEVQISAIDKLAKKYAQTVSQHTKVNEVFLKFTNNVTKDDKLLLDLKKFIEKEVTPYVDEQTDIIAKVEDPVELEKQIERLEQKVIDMVRDYLFKSNGFQTHLTQFATDLKAVQKDLVGIIDRNAKEELTKIAGEKLFTKAKAEFDPRFAKYLEEEFADIVYDKFDFNVLLDKVLDIKDNESPKPDGDKTPPKENGDDKTPPKGNDGDKTPPTINGEDKTPPNNISNTPPTIEDEDENVIPADENTVVVEDELDAANPSVPRTGDGSIQKVASPLAVTLMSMLVAFVLLPKRLFKRRNQY